MSKNYFFHSLNIKNFRGINSVEIENLRRVNIFGGVNGVGKSTVLEALLLLCARMNPLMLSRPYLNRHTKLPYPNGFDYVFYDYNFKNSVSISGIAKTGAYKFEIKSHNVHDLQVNTPNSISTESEFSRAVGESRGVSLTLHTNNGTLFDDLVVAQSSPDNIAFNVKQGNVAKSPFCQFVSLSEFNPVEDAQRYSALVKERNTSALIKYLRLLFEDLKGLQLLHESGSPVIYVEFSDETLVPTIMLGGGFQMMLSIALVMMTAKDGVFLFDEVDSAIHHSLLPKFWATVAKIASDTNGQVFAVTHSRECIGAAVKGMVDANKLNDLGYFRLEERLNNLQSISYSGEELQEALSTDWEVR